MATPPTKMTSDLCKPLSVVLTDNSSVSMLDYFIQYMEAEDAIHIVQFWLSVEAFKSTPLTTHTSSILNSDQSQECLTLQSATMISVPADDKGGELRGAMCAADPSTADCTAGGDIVCNGSTHGRVSETTEQHVTDSSKSEKLSNNYVEEHRQTTSSNGPLLTRPVQQQPGSVVVERSLKENGEIDVAGICCEDDHFRTSHRKEDMQTTAPLYKQGSLSVGSDAMEIYTTYIALNATCPVGVPADIRQRIEVNICPEDGHIDRQCFREAQEFVFKLLETRYYPEFLRSSYLCKYQLEYISSGLLTLLDLLLADNALFYFMEYMEQEGASSLIQFWLMADNFFQHLSSPSHTPNVDVDTQDAIAIYDRFFSLQSANPLGMGDMVRMDIENKICDEKGPRVDSFTLAQDNAYATMQEVYYPSFLKSSIYLRFLNELVHMLNSDHIGNQQTTQDANSSVIEPETEEYREDLDDPDTIWRRPHTLMRLGYVDEFGQFISEAGICDLKDGSHKGRFAWMIRKRQQEEELTMRIARNIVTEVLESCRSRTTGV